MNLETEEGWLILDGRGRRWDSHLYKTQAAAEVTASACVSGPYTVRHARRVARWQQLATTLARPSAEYILSP